MVTQLIQMVWLIIYVKEICWSESCDKENHRLEEFHLLVDVVPPPLDQSKLVNKYHTVLTGNYMGLWTETEWTAQDMN